MEVSYTINRRQVQYYTHSVLKNFQAVFFCNKKRSYFNLGYLDLIYRRYGVYY